MTDAATLRALADRVEAEAHAGPKWMACLTIDIHDALETGDTMDDVGVARILGGHFGDGRGDVNAALALREAVLGDQWTAVRLRSLQRMTRWAGEVSRLTRDGEENAVSAHAPTPARALLAATLRAKAAEVELTEGPLNR